MSHNVSAPRGPFGLHAFGIRFLDLTSEGKMANVVAVVLLLLGPVTSVLACVARRDLVRIAGRHPLRGGRVDANLQRT
jgi:hypothetical protein